MSEGKGHIYILTNPSFPDYVKIGYADDVEKRLNELNRTECTPFAFRIYATYAVQARLTDLKIHEIIDIINPDLRSIDNVNGKKRVREFYAMSAENAYQMFRAMAEIHGTLDNLVKIKPDAKEVHEERMAEVISIEQEKKRDVNWTFNDLDVPIGAILTYINNENIKCRVVDERRIEYEGEIMYVTPFARMISGKKWLSHGPRYLVGNFLYEGKLLRDYEKTEKEDIIGLKIAG